MTATLRRTTALACEIAEDSAVLLTKRRHSSFRSKKRSCSSAAICLRRCAIRARGSSMINPTKLTTPRAAFDAMGVRLCLLRAAMRKTAHTTIGALLREALDGAKKFQKALVFAGLTDYVESEGCDPGGYAPPRKSSSRSSKGLSKKAKQVIVVSVRGLARGAGRSRTK